MKKWLVWIEIGGENGHWTCDQADYAICHGESKQEVLLDWVSKNEERGLSFENIYYDEECQHYYGRYINIFELPENFEDNKWKKLNWE